MDAARTDAVDAELDRFISKGASQDRNPDRDENDELWKASVARHNARRHEEMRVAWCEYHQGQDGPVTAVLAELIARHEAQAAKLEDGKE